MDFSAAHVDVVVAAYVLTALCILALCLWILQKDRGMAKQLRALDDKSKRN